MICAKLDSQLQRLARAHRCWYTRYADDLTFSTNKAIPAGLAVSLPGGRPDVVVGHDLTRVVSQNGFEINMEKVRLQRRHQRQEVTGLVVNQGVNVRRSYVRQIQAMLHAWRKHGLQAADDEFHRKYDRRHRLPRYDTPSFRDVVLGKLAFVRMVKGADDRVYIGLAGRLSMLDEAFREAHAEELADDPRCERDVFLCHAGEDKAGIVEPLYHALKAVNITCWYDRREICAGDSIPASVNEGLRGAQYKLIVLSQASRHKSWPREEINAIIGQQTSSGTANAIVLVVGATEDEEQELIAEFPLLSHRYYLKWRDGVDSVVAEIQRRLERDQA